MAVWHERYLCRSVLEDKGYELRDGIALNVKLGGQQRLQVANVLIADVTLIRPGMYGDALSSEALAILCHPQYVGVVASTGITYGGNLIYVYT